MADNRLRVARAEKKVTQLQLRLVTNINQTKISHIENGYIQPKDDEKKKLARALGVRVEEIFPEKMDRSGQ